MSNRGCQAAASIARASLRQSRPFRITPPPTYLLQATYFTRRSTSFYTNSYPQSSSSGVEIPYTPPSPTPEKSSSSSHPENEVYEDGRRKERKAKYLESLMDKAGELSLRCKASHQTVWAWLITEAQSSIRTENGELKKVDTKRQNYVVNMI